MNKPYHPALPEQGPAKPRRKTVEEDPIKNPVNYTKAVVTALQALAGGRASEEQQKKVLDWIINEAAATYDLPFRLGGIDGQRASDFACGRAFVGNRIVHGLKIIVSRMPSDPNADQHEPS